MTNREREYAAAESNACHYADRRLEWWATNNRFNLPDLFEERFSDELWRCYRQAFLDGITWAEDERRTAYKEAE